MAGLLKHQTVNFANKCRLIRFTYFIVHQKNLRKLNLGIILIKSDTNFKFRFFLVLTPLKCAFYHESTKYLFLYVHNMHFYARSILNAWAQPFSLLKRSILNAHDFPCGFPAISIRKHKSLVPGLIHNPNGPSWTPAPPHPKLGGGSAPSPLKIDKLPKIYIFRKEKPSICFTHLFCRRGGGNEILHAEFHPPPHLTCLVTPHE